MPDDKVQELEREMNAFRKRIEDKLAEVSASIKRDVAQGGARSQETEQLIAESLRLQEEGSRRATELQKEFGITDEILDAIERSQKPRLEDRYWREQMADVQTTGSIDELLTGTLEVLSGLVHPSWLAAEAQKPHRLDELYLSSPLQLVGSQRLGDCRCGPQRFAKMLLVCRDHLEQHEYFDFHEAPLLISEAVMLGSQLDEIQHLGAEATSKLKSLSKCDDDAFESTIYELLVGAGCIRSGLDVEMLTTKHGMNGKSPDFRVRGLGPPIVIECKRRRLENHVLSEGQKACLLYQAIRGDLQWACAHVAVDFTVPIDDVSSDEFRRDVNAILREDDFDMVRDLRWGRLRCSQSERRIDVSRTRLYAPNFLEQVFGWSQEYNEWDGLICEVEPPRRVLIERANTPICMKWRSSSPDLAVKKARGLTSMWGDAIKQIPPGEMGIIYIAYTESARPDIADSRTRNIMETSKEKWNHQASITVPLVVVNRLYPRALGVGVPDLIENSLPMYTGNDPHMVATFPSNIFTVAPP